MSTAYITPTAYSHSSLVNLADHVDAHPRLMDRGATDYPPSGLQSPYLALRDSQSEDAPTADHASAAQYTHTPQPDARPANFASSSTPTSEYSVNTPSARSANFPPEYLARPQQYAHHQNNSSGSAGNMAQATSPSISLQDGHQHNHHTAPHMKSDPDVPIDPSIAASSPTFPGHYSPYPPQGNDMGQYQGHPPPQMYGRPDWPPQYAQHAHGMPGPYSSPGTAVSSASSVATAGPRPGQVSLPTPPPHLSLAVGARRLTRALSQVYSFVPIPGAQQHKRPRRRYEEIERMYKCGWHGCEKAYGTLNHLNAHVTMQSHGQKRTPEGKAEVFFFCRVFMFALRKLANAVSLALGCLSRVTQREALSWRCGYASRGFWIASHHLGS